MLALVGCSPAPLTRDRLVSSFHSIASNAAEAELFLDRLQKHQATSVYARTYADSLADAIRQNRQELQHHPPAKGLESGFAECQREYELLLESVNGLKTALNDRDALAAAKVRMETIRKKAEQSLHAVESSGMEGRVDNPPPVNNRPHTAAKPQPTSAGMRPGKAGLKSPARAEADPPFAGLEIRQNTQTPLLAAELQSREKAAAV